VSVIGELLVRPCDRVGDRFFPLQDLEVAEIVRSIIATGAGIAGGAGVQLLWHLMCDGDECDGLRFVKADSCEQVDDLFRDAEFVCAGAADLVVAEFEWDRQPVS